MYGIDLSKTSFYFPDRLICLNRIDQTGNVWVVCLSRKNKAGKGCLICLSRIDQAEEGALFATAGFIDPAQANQAHNQKTSKLRILVVSLG